MTDRHRRLPELSHVLDPTTKEQAAMRITIRNYTPHVVNVIADDALGTVIASFPSEGEVRVDTSQPTVIGRACGAPIVTASFGEVTGLPYWYNRSDTMIIVSSMVVGALEAARQPTGNLLVPHDPVRTSDGVVVGCRALRAVPERVDTDLPAEVMYWLSRGTVLPSVRAAVAGGRVAPETVEDLLVDIDEVAAMLGVGVDKIVAAWDRLPAEALPPLDEPPRWWRHDIERGMNDRYGPGLVKEES